MLHFFYPKSLIRTIHYVFELINLGLNAISNGFGTSYLLSLIFIVGFGWLFFSLSIGSLAAFTPGFIPDNDKLIYFTQFLLPTHKFNYLGDKVLLNICFYIWDFIGRLFVGYGIYQFIQAFRKYR
ncbi:MAG: hypothetical protein Roseis2KO_41470 [Roseivirga sp.]